MRIGLISDPHANILALQAIEAELNKAGVDCVWCLGDIVGYGPDPEQVIEWVRSNCTLCLAGNHDQVLRGSGPWMVGPTLEVLQWTKTVIGREDQIWLHSLKPRALSEEIEAHCFHGGPSDEAWQFITSSHDAREALQMISSRLLLCGHTHVPGWFSPQSPKARSLGNRLYPPSLKPCKIPQNCLINPGAVGRPQGDKAAIASCCVLDTQENTMQWLQASYDVEKVQANMAYHGLPVSLIKSLNP